MPDSSLPGKHDAPEGLNMNMTPRGNTHRSGVSLMSPRTLLLKGSRVGYHEGNDVYFLRRGFYAVEDGVAYRVPKADVEFEDEEWAIYADPAI
jgi:hypothetical protein